MDEEKIKEIVSGAVSDAFKEQQMQPMVCQLGIDREEHDQSHVFVRSLMEVSGRLDKIKWGFLGAVIKGTGLFVVGILCFGLIAWLKVEVSK